MSTAPLGRLLHQLHLYRRDSGELCRNLAWVRRHLQSEPVSFGLLRPGRLLPDHGAGRVLFAVGLAQRAIDLYTEPVSSADGCLLRSDNGWMRGGDTGGVFLSQDLAFGMDLVFAESLPASGGLLHRIDLYVHDSGSLRW